MSGIVGSRHNIRGSGLVGSLGTDGQVFTSAGAGTGAVFEDAAGGGSMNLIKTLAASSSATLSFVNGTSDVVLDTTYNVYCFTFNSLHPATVNPDLNMNVSDDAGSNYDLAKTQHSHRSWCDEGGSDSGAGTDTTGLRLGNGTGVAPLMQSLGADADHCMAGRFWIYNPGDTTFVKHYEWKLMIVHSSHLIYTHEGAGYVNDTAAVDAIQFSFSTGNMDAGSISMYGITK